MIISCGILMNISWLGKCRTKKICFSDITWRNETRRSTPTNIDEIIYWLYIDFKRKQEKHSNRIKSQNLNEPNGNFHKCLTGNEKILLFFRSQSKSFINEKVLFSQSFSRKNFHIANESLLFPRWICHIEERKISVCLSRKIFT